MRIVEFLIRGTLLNKYSLCLEKAKLLSQQNFLLCAWRMQFNSLVNNDRFSQRTGRCVLHETECKKKKKKKKSLTLASWVRSINWQKKKLFFIFRGI